MSAETETTTLYRIENPNIPPKPDGVVSHEDLIGQWFSPNLPTVIHYLRKSTQTFGHNAHPVDGAQLVMAKVPTEQLDAMHVSLHPVAADMDVEGDNYIVPLDGGIETSTLPLDETLGGLKGTLGRVDRLQEASRRIELLVAEHDKVSQW